MKMRHYSITVIIKSEKSTYFHIKKILPSAALKLPRLRTYFPCEACWVLDGFYTVKVKDFIQTANESHGHVRNLSM